MSEEDDEEYDFEYSDEEEEEEDSEDVEIGNLYYEAKSMKNSGQVEAALIEFQKVIELEGQNKGEYGFKALKQMVKIYWSIQNYTEMMIRYKELLSYVVKNIVKRNFSEKGIISVLDLVSSSSIQQRWQTAMGSDTSIPSHETEASFALLESFYQTTLDILKDARSDRLWFKTNMKLGYVYFHAGKFTRLNKVLKQLMISCQPEDQVTDITIMNNNSLGLTPHRQGSQLLEIYALQIQMYTIQKDNKNLKALYHRSLKIKSAIPHPRVQGIIRECGGKMHMRQRQWDKARTDFFEAFKSYDEAGDKRKINCLKYLVLANMLMASDINPFDSQETKSYENHKEIKAMTNLVHAFINNQVSEFERILQDNRATIMDDPFINNYINDLLKTVRSQILEKMIQPYTSINIDYISKELHIPEDEVEELLVNLILDDRIDGLIDQVNSRLLLNKHRKNQNNKYQSLQQMSEQLCQVADNLGSKFRSPKGFTMF